MSSCDLRLSHLGTSSALCWKHHLAPREAVNMAGKRGPGIPYTEWDVQRRNVYLPVRTQRPYVAANHRGVRVRSPHRRRWPRAGTVVHSAREGRCRGSRRYRL